MAESSKPKSGGGCLGKLFSLIILIVVCTLGSAVIFVIQPQDLSDIGGYGPSVNKAAPRDLKAVLEAALKRGYPVTLTETEINQWIGQTLAAKQGGFLAGQVSLERVWVRLSDGYAEVVTERTFMGRPFTVSMFLKVEQRQGAGSVRTEVHRHGGQYHEAVTKPLRGGRFGKLVVPQGFLLLVMPSYEKLAEVYRKEIHLAFEEMVRIRIEQKRLVLESREPTANGSTRQARTF
jgi:hypothetical protein